MSDTDQRDSQSLSDEEVQLGQRLREARESLGLAQEDVAEELGIPRASISAIETGKRKVSSIELKRFARLYLKPISDFLQDGGENVASDDISHALLRVSGTLDAEGKRAVLTFAKYLRQMQRRKAAELSDDDAGGDQIDDAEDLP